MPGTKEFAAAIVPDRWRVFGFKLRPLCLGNWLLLHRACPRLFEADQVADVTAVILAAMICSTEYDPKRPTSCLQTGWLFTLRAALIRFACMRVPGLFTTRLVIFQRYIEQSSKTPRVWRVAPGEPGGSGTPWEVHLLTTLLQSGVGLADAMQMPLGAAWWISACVHERAGIVQVDDSDDDAGGNGHA